MRGCTENLPGQINRKKVRIYTHLYRTNAEIAGFSRNIYEPWMENR